MKNRFIFAVAIFVATLVAAFFFNKYKVAPAIKFETLDLTDIEERKISLDSFQNKKLFINFFATWCGPCLRELPSILEAQQKLSKEKIQFILISDEPLGKLIYFNEQTGGQFTVLHSEKSLQQYKIYSIPTSYLLNSGHEIIFKKTGEENWCDEKMLKRFREAE